MSWLRKIALFAIGVVFLLPVLARAQAPSPNGNWATNPPSERLYVSPRGCRFTGTNGARTSVIEGQCSWKSSGRGGILTIMNIHQLVHPAPIYYNVVWVNAKQITVYGDVFYKQN
jgi:hypothetical protein